MRKLGLVLGLGLAAACTPAAPDRPAPAGRAGRPDPAPAGRAGRPDPAPTEYLAHALDLVEDKAFYAGRVDWPKVRAEAVRMATGARVAADTYPAIRHALAALGDGHSRLVAPDRVQGDGFPDGPPTGGALSPRIGYLRLTQVNGKADADAAHQYVRAAERVLTDGRNACGWVIDVRQNPGGNLVPMLLALRPLLGDGDALRVRDRAGAVKVFRVTDGGLGFGADHQTGPPTGLAPFSPPRPVAVLTDEETASSAEDVLVAFRGRDGTRSFGTPTAGLTTSNESFPLSDKALLLLTVGVVQDVKARTYEGPVPADEEVRAPSERPTTAEADPVVMAARRWLERSHRCH